MAETAIKVEPNEDSTGERKNGSAAPRLSGLHGLCSPLFWREVRVSDAVVPAEGVLVEEDPGVTHSCRGSGKIAGQNAPAAQSAAGGTSVEAGQFEPSDPQARSAAGINDKKL